MRPAVYIPHFNGFERLERALGSLRAQTRPVDVVVADNGSSDGSAELLRERFPEVGLIELGRNLGFGPALNRAIEEEPGDPVILLNDDVECEPRFVEAMLDALDESAQMVAGVLVQERSPGLIDSAGVVADSTLMGFDWTRWPSSIRPWIASVISYSPRQEGSRARAASKIEGLKR
jgi:GT2 family glycosyltransferase